MKRSLILTGLLFLFVGCETAPKKTYDDKLKEWVGKSSTDLLLKWGAPAQSFEQEGNKFVTYLFDGGTVLVQMPVTGVANVRRYCKTTFQINNQNLVQSYSWEGNACR